MCLGKKPPWFSCFIPGIRRFGRSKLMDTSSERTVCHAGKVQQPLNQLNQRTDLTDTLILFKSYLANRLENLKEELSTCNGVQKKKENHKIPLRKGCLSSSRTKAKRAISCHKLEHLKSSCKAPAKTGKPSTKSGTQQFQWSVCILVSESIFTDHFESYTCKRLIFFTWYKVVYLIKGTLFGHFKLRENQIILDTIKNGYDVPFTTVPPRMEMKSIQLSDRNCS